MNKMVSDDARGYYPLYLALRGQPCLVVGGGGVGERKVMGLLRCGAVVRVVARELTEQLSELGREGRIEWVARDYREDLLDGVRLVFAATSDEGLNRTVGEDALRRSVPCNMATEPENGSFIVPSVFERGPLTIAIGTGGLSPAVSKLIRQRLEGMFGDEWGVFLTLMGILRAAVQSRGLGTDANQRLFRSAANLPIPEWIEEGRPDRVVDAMHDLCRAWFGRDEISQMWDDAWKAYSSS
ncbi:MAG: bifunctional precorrin-2 dehydrogenase/sirohydrochlorin ferrochelatase [Acidobacteriota bacterium]